ncbi:hypothetical protein P168DRAFT_292688 [Aspergillus campestris IBT 28561]|uniref:Uncharacterized protein n=1 Tax=Aspergillus campestris (strain IBT 28561) TaxID=1392248 RepID=A0A2I1CVE2_ASPC2|nr:uncharacterized protein P168DRAFT_292688 [Aspergillus campestris IBT 28561]PKY01591.1 hypothetical protein P168DRAFT_292688 [Aspergillus campestris IBT 28561]
MGTSLHLDRRHVQSAQTSGLQMDPRTTADAAARSRGQLSQDKLFDGSIHSSDHNFGSRSPRSISPKAIQNTPKVAEEIQFETTRMGAGGRINGQQMRQDPLLSGVQSKGAHSIVEPLSRSPKTAVGQRGTAAGVIKPPGDTDVSPRSIERRRSRSIGSGARGSRIAALSVHLRTRLSYAAAKVEKSRKSQSAQIQLPSGFLLDDSQGLDGPDGGRLRDAASPDGTTVSAPDPPGASHIYPLNGTPRLLPAGSSENHTQTRQLEPSKSPTSSELSIPKLAPPVDIVSGSSNRRRPNPNEPSIHDHRTPISLHRRHHSQQEFSLQRPFIGPDTVLVPGTPPLRPTGYPNHIPFNGMSSQDRHSQNTSMEQDAIETLLFMSSPGNSGYRSNSQPSQQQNHFPSSIGASTGAWTRNSQSDHNNRQTICKKEALESGLEANAGDEIDRMLDQMESDSEDEKPFVRDMAKKAIIKKESTSDQDRRALSG